MRIACCVENLGNPQRSLQYLRNAIARSIDHPIRIVEVKTGEIHTSFFVIDIITDSITWTGDGFRLDLQGEGGASLETAKVLFLLYNMKVDVLFDALDLDTLHNVDLFMDTNTADLALETLLRDYLLRNQQEIEATRLICAADELPAYVRT